MSLDPSSKSRNYWDTIRNGRITSNIWDVAESSNGAAHCLAVVGMNNWDSMHLVLKSFGHLQEKLDQDTDSLTAGDAHSFG